MTIVSSELQNNSLHLLRPARASIAVPAGDAFVFSHPGENDASQLMVLVEPVRHSLAAWREAEQFIIALKMACQQQGVPESVATLVDLLAGVTNLSITGGPPPPLAAVITLPDRLISFQRGGSTVVITGGESLRESPIAQPDTPENGERTATWSRNTRCRAWLVSRQAWLTIQHAAATKDDTTQAIHSIWYPPGATVVSIPLASIPASQLPSLVAHDDLDDRFEVTPVTRGRDPVTPAPIDQRLSQSAWALPSRRRYRSRRRLAFLRFGLSMPSLRSTAAAVSIIALLLIASALLPVLLSLAGQGDEPAMQVAATGGHPAATGPVPSRIGLLPGNVAADTIALLPLGNSLYLATFEGLYRLDPGNRQLLPVAMRGDQVGGRLLGNLIHAEIDGSTLVLIDGAAIYRMIWNGAWVSDRITLPSALPDCSSGHCAIFQGNVLLLDTAHEGIETIATTDEAIPLVTPGLPAGTMNGRAAMLAAGDLFLLQENGAITNLLQPPGENVTVWDLDGHQFLAMTGSEQGQTLYLVVQDARSAAIVRYETASSESKWVSLPPAATFAGLQAIAIQDATGQIWWIAGGVLWQMFIA